MNIYNYLIYIILGAFFVGLFILVVIIKTKNMDKWIISYFIDQKIIKINSKHTNDKIIDVHLLLVDHFEPFCEKCDRTKAVKKVKFWKENYLKVSQKFLDFNHRSPQHVYFYPAEQYDYEIIEILRVLKENGLGDVEVHLHHDNDSPEGLKEKLEEFITTLYYKHRLLRRNKEGQKISYAFIHGDWALDNSRKDGKYCGVNNEIDILINTGCYADFTFPSAPSETQPRTINKIYFAKDNPNKPKSYNKGIPAQIGHWENNLLLMVQGPLALKWKERKYCILPRIENGELSADNPITRARVELWAKLGIHVKGAPNRIFIKVHTHGMEDRNLNAFFKQGLLEDFYREIIDYFRPENGYRLHFQTAHETYNIIKSICLKDYLK